VRAAATATRRFDRRRIPLGTRRGVLERAAQRHSPTGWTVDYPEVHPDPSPVTTIAWRLLHISDGNTIYWEHGFGPGIRNFWDLAPHGDAVGAIGH